MVKGRLPRESNPLPGDKSGFAASHDTTGEEDYKRTSPLNPFPVKSIGDSNVKDAAVKAELESIKATQEAILSKLDSGVNTQLTGSKDEYVRESTDEKPAGKENDTLFLWDTGEVFLHDGTEWRGV